MDFKVESYKNRRGFKKNITRNYHKKFHYYMIVGIFFKQDLRLALHSTYLIFNCLPGKNVRYPKTWHFLFKIFAQKYILRVIILEIRQGQTNKTISHYFH